SLKLEYFIAEDVPPYAILSHTWEEEEVTYQDFIAATDDRESKKGWRKIRRMCELAKDHWLEYAWVDTCCIDKSSSAELSEAINSMYGYYRESRVCFAFLSDWIAHSENENDLHSCRWFTRGWTLQELIAPMDIIFFDSRFEAGGTKFTLVEKLSAVTYIDMELLFERRLIAEFSVAQKMSWAARRRTTRTEDRAYSMLGIFDLNVPLLYGEGSKAFRRLQEEIIRSTTDTSIFAWKLERSFDPGYLP
ncbi:hypothetical protein EK21DRAFT_46044, partial [Setomelanomma holmii]